MTSAQTPKTIKIAGDGCHKEGIAGAAITPGMLIAYNAAGAVVPHADEGDQAMPYFAKEYDLTGRDITDAYASGDQVLFEAGYVGAQYYGLITAGETIAFNDPLTSNGDGTLREAVVGENIVAYAREAVSPVGSAGRCIVEVGSGYVSTT